MVDLGGDDGENRSAYNGDVMRTILLAALIGCGDNRRPITPDAAIDVDAATDAYSDPNFFGEPCDFWRNPDYPEALAICHCDFIDPVVGCVRPSGSCVEEPVGSGIGVCREACDQLHPEWNPEYVCIGRHAGGIPTWTPGQDGVSAGQGVPGSWCYCRPPQ